MLNRPFGAADIVALSRNPDRDLSVRSGKGFSFPERGWVYAATEAYYRSGRLESALWDAFDRVVTGRAITTWKEQRRTDLEPLLGRFLACDRRSDARFLDSAFNAPPRVITWREHDLRLPLGHVFEDATGRGLRLLWIERSNRPRWPSSDLLAAATLAAFETTRGELAWLETWFLRSGEVGRYRPGDLRSRWARLDRMLATAEERAT